MRHTGLGPRAPGVDRRYTDVAQQMIIEVGESVPADRSDNPATEHPESRAYSTRRATSSTRLPPEPTELVHVICCGVNDVTVGF